MTLKKSIPFLFRYLLKSVFISLLFQRALRASMILHRKSRIITNQLLGDEYVILNGRLHCEKKAIHPIPTLIRFKLRNVVRQYFEW